jgi:hypothetical protein
VDDLGKNLGELEKVIGGKSDNVRIVEDGESAASVFSSSLYCPVPCILAER